MDPPVNKVLPVSRKPYPELREILGLRGSTAPDLPGGRDPRRAPPPAFVARLPVSSSVLPRRSHLAPFVEASANGRTYIAEQGSPNFYFDPEATCQRRQGGSGPQVFGPASFLWAQIRWVAPRDQSDGRPSTKHWGGRDLNPSYEKQVSPKRPRLHNSARFG